MGFPEALIQQALSIASQSNQMLQIEAIIELIISMTLQTAPSRDRYAGWPLVSPGPFGSQAAAGRGQAAVGGGARADSLITYGSARSAVVVQPDEVSGQIDIISGTLWKQRHIWGFSLQSIEQVEVIHTALTLAVTVQSTVTAAQVQVVIHEGHAKLRYFDVGTGVLRRTLFLQGCQCERGAQPLLQFAANCTVCVSLAQSRPLSSITLLFDDEQTARQWQQAISFAVSSTIPMPSQPDAPHAAAIFNPIPRPTAPPALQCIICLEEIPSVANAIRCPTGQHYIHNGDCFDGCVQSQVDDARLDPGQFHSRGSCICCPVCPTKRGGWTDADIKKVVKGSTWKVSACGLCSTSIETTCPGMRC